MKPLLLCSLIVLVAAMFATYESEADNRMRMPASLIERQLIVQLHRENPAPTFLQLMDMVDARDGARAKGSEDPYVEALHTTHKVHAGIDFFEVLLHQLHHHPKVVEALKSKKTEVMKLFKEAVDGLSKGWKSLQNSKQVLWMKTSMDRTIQGLEGVISRGEQAAKAAFNGMANKATAAAQKAKKAMDTWKINKFGATESAKTLKNALKNWGDDIGKAKTYVAGWLKGVKSMTESVGTAVKTSLSTATSSNIVTKLKSAIEVAVKSKPVQAALKPLAQLSVKAGGAFDAIVSKAKAGGATGALKVAGKAVMAAGVILHMYEGYVYSKNEQEWAKGVNAVLRGAGGLLLMANPYVAIVAVLSDLLLPKEFSITEGVGQVADGISIFIEYAVTGNSKLADKFDEWHNDIMKGEKPGTALVKWGIKLGGGTILPGAMSLAAALRGDTKTLERLRTQMKNGEHGWMYQGVVVGAEKLHQAIEKAKQEIPDILEDLGEKAVQVSNWANGLLNDLKSGWDNLVRNVSTMASNAYEGGKKMVQNAYEGGKKMLQNTGKAISSGWNSLTSTVGGWFK